MADMNVKPATIHPQATQEIDGMIAMIETLMEKGYAYDVNGTVYFRTRKFEEYGKLSHKNLDDLRSGNRSLLVSGEDQKEDPLDFVLWKPKKEEFVPLQEGKVTMYVCGPTVYNFIHIGNARPMIVFDTVRRYMEYKGYEVNFVSNFTDVDDKIIKKSIEEGVSAEEV